MTGFRSKTTQPLAAASRPAWRHFVVFGLVAVLLVVLLSRLGGFDEIESRDAPVLSGESSTFNVIETTDVSTEVHPLAAKVEPPGRAFIASLNLQPRMINGRPKGFVVRPDDPAILQGTPLQPGDVLLEVDGLELDAERAAALVKRVGDYDDVYISFERGGTPKDGMLPLGTR